MTGRTYAVWPGASRVLLISKPDQRKRTKRLTQPAGISQETAQDFNSTMQPIAMSGLRIHASQAISEHQISTPLGCL
jgi:hypothetical protein